MKIIHLLPVKRFQFVNADNIYYSNLIEHFSKILGLDYLLIIGSQAKWQFKDVNLLNLKLRVWGKDAWLYFRLPYVYYFFWFVYFMLTNKIKSSETIFFSSDPNATLILIWWRKIFRCKFKICYDWHSLFNNFKDGFISKNSDCLITTSEKLKKSIVERFGINSNKIQVVYGGVDILGYQNVLNSRLELGLPKNKKLIGYVGLFKTMGMEKGIKTMVEALKYLSQEVAMVFVGARPGQAEEYIKIAKTFQVEDRCIFIDMQPTEKMPAYEKAMDILVIPYPNKPHFRDFGFPMKVYEYMASRRPIIYSKLELVEEVIGDCAVGFKADNAKDLAKKIIEVEKNKAHHSALAEKAYEKVKEYSWQKKAEKIINFIKISS